MFKRLGFLAALIFTPLPALAAIINIEYTGHITSSDISFYEYGTTVSGNIKVDLSKANGDELPEDFQALYTSWTNYDLVTGYITDDAGYPGDRVEVINNSNEKYSGNYIDYLAIMDVIVVPLDDGGWQYYTMQLNIGLVGLDWIFNDSLDIQDIFVNDASLFDLSFGVYGMGSGWYDEAGEPQLSNAAAFFSFDSLKVTSGAAVPEPSSIVLLLMGFLGITLHRKLAAR
jgi:hypothetical protein